MTNDNITALRDLAPNIVLKLAMIGLRPSDLKVIHAAARALMDKDGIEGSQVMTGGGLMEAGKVLEIWKDLVERAHREVAEDRRRGLRWHPQVTIEYADGSWRNECRNAVAEELLRVDLAR